jgi:hypothetical protein
MTCPHEKARPVAGTLGDIIRFRCADCSLEWTCVDCMLPPNGLRSHEKSALRSSDSQMARKVEEMGRVTR